MYKGLITLVKINDLERDIEEFVLEGGFDAFTFSMQYAPKYNNIPGRDLQLLIDEAKTKEE